MKVRGRRVPRPIVLIDQRAKKHAKLADQADARGDKVTAKREQKLADRHRKDFDFQLAAFLKEFTS